MATKRDLVEAYSFSRRRLVTAFVSGAPGGREVEPTRPARTLVGGVALGVLMIAGAAVAGIFTDKAPSDWDQPGLVISKEEGAAYVILDDGDEDPDALPELRPVINITSARLILGDAALSPRIVAQETIESRPLGDDIGILRAPASLPGTDRLVQTGWTACTGTGLGLAVDVGRESRVTRATPDQAVLVHVEAERASDPEYWVVGTAPQADDEPAQAYRYALPNAGRAGDFLREANLSATSEAVEVPLEWLALFPRGGDLDLRSFGLDRFGEAVSGQSVSVGDYAPDDQGGVLVDDEGQVEGLSPFAYSLYTALVRDSREVEERSLDALTGQYAADAASAARWPREVTGGTAGEQCAVLDTLEDGAPTAALAGAPVDTASAADLEAGQRDVEVDPGAGAFVSSGDWGESTSPNRWVVDQKGGANALDGSDTPSLLGYGSVPAVLVPDAWLQLFDPGVTLSQALALCPPSTDPDPCS